MFICIFILFIYVFIYYSYTSHGILHCLWSTNLSKSFPRSIVLANIYLCSNFFFNRFCRVEKCEITPRCLYLDSLTLIILLVCMFTSYRSVTKKLCEIIFPGQKTFLVNETYPLYYRIFSNLVRPLISADGHFFEI